MATKEEAQRYLGDAAPEQCFWVNNGPIVRNLDELENSLSEISEDAYNHHVNPEKNDFSRWINDVICDKKLANDLLSSKSKDSTIKKIRNRINSLKKKVG